MGYGLNSGGGGIFFLSLTVVYSTLCYTIFVAIMIPK